VRYKTVLADPPWPERGAGKIKRGADRHYKLMTIKDITEYMKQLPYDDNCHLYMWVTNNYLKDGIQIINDIGFRYITNIVWMKDRFGLGQYYRGQHELLLFAVKGRLPYRSKSETSVIIAKRRKHSEKPKEQYKKIEAVSHSPYLEVFARKKREGWDSWGDEVDKSYENNTSSIDKYLS